MWKYYNPTFEFRSEMPLNLAYAPWGGHSYFAYPFYHGLGVVFLGNKLGDKPVDNACIDHYKQLADKLG